MITVDVEFVEEAKAFRKADLELMQTQDSWALHKAGERLDKAISKFDSQQATQADGGAHA